MRISNWKKTFKKGYLKHWTEEIFIITQKLPRSPPVYRLKDTKEEEIIGVFYEDELQNIIENKDKIE